jgi:hypothetical protein
MEPNVLTKENTHLHASTNPPYDVRAEVVRLRYQDRVEAIKNGERAAICPISLSSKRLLSFLKKEFHIINLSMNFLRRLQHDERYIARQVAVQRAMKNAETLVTEWQARCVDEITLNGSPVGPAMHRMVVPVRVLTPRAAKLVDLLQRTDGIMEMLRVLEIRGRITNDDRLIVIQKLMNAFLLIKTAGMGEKSEVSNLSTLENPAVNTQY